MGYTQQDNGKIEKEDWFSPFVGIQFDYRK